MKTYKALGTETHFDAVVIGNGDFPQSPIALGLLNSGAFVCCCDGAVATAIRHGIQPQAIVGDGDSISEELKERFQDILHIITEQDDNDQTKATRFLKKMGFRRIVYLAATGKREDHTMGNIALLEKYQREMGLQVSVVSDFGYFIPAFGNSTFMAKKGTQVSLFNVSCTEMNSTGLKWQAFPFQSLWQGTLNESLGDEFQVFGNGGYIVYFAFC